MDLQAFPVAVLCTLSSVSPDCLPLLSPQYGIPKEMHKAGNRENGYTLLDSVKFDSVFH